MIKTRLLLKGEETRARSQWFVRVKHPHAQVQDMGSLYHGSLQKLSLSPHHIQCKRLWDASSAWPPGFIRSTQSTKKINSGIEKLSLALWSMLKKHEGQSESLLQGPKDSQGDVPISRRHNAWQERNSPPQTHPEISGKFTSSGV